jgi:hypothetical protein
MNSCAAWNDQHIIDNYVFAQSEQSRCAIFRLPAAQGLTRPDPYQRIFEYSDLKVGVGADEDARLRRREVALASVRRLLLRLALGG